ncbi:hypothetical protein [Nocardiopsis rhodophaea]|uniref:hypothetical protein n=1 Tax=Nocardiopsis rhodophaea TaxID=280238 RepID=UPI0031E19F65
MSGNRSMPVKIRLMGRPEDVAIWVDHIKAVPDSTVFNESEPYENGRRNRDQVRVYLDVSDR